MAKAYKKLMVVQVLRLKAEVEGGTSAIETEAKVTSWWRLYLRATALHDLSLIKKGLYAEVKYPCVSNRVPGSCLLLFKECRMKKRFLLVFMLSASLIVASCRTGTWHPSKERSEWGKDHAECEQIIRDGVRDNPASYDTLDEMKLIKSCMRKKGWRNK